MNEPWEATAEPLGLNETQTTILTTIRYKVSGKRAEDLAELAKALDLPEAKVLELGLEILKTALKEKDAKLALIQGDTLKPIKLK
ncbi:MAG: hypothetical protein AAGA60_15650 [Cyanobacteria bacterium P01_E01_bin.42]